MKIDDGEFKRYVRILDSVSYDRGFDESYTQERFKTFTKPFLSGLEVSLYERAYNYALANGKGYFVDALTHQLNALHI